MGGVIIHIILGLIFMIFIFSTQDAEERKKELRIKALKDIKSGKRITTFNINTCR